MANNLENQLNHLMSRSEDVASRIQSYVSSKKQSSLETNLQEDANVKNDEFDESQSESLDVCPYKFIYLGYSYVEMPSYADTLKKEMEPHNFLIFNPLVPVEQQFHEAQHKEALKNITSKVKLSELKFLKLSYDYNKPLEEVLPIIRQADTKTDVDSMIFKELYFLMRSSLMICDLNMEPYGPELYQKLFYAKLFEIPVIGIAPSGRTLSPYIFKYTKVLLTDSFNLGNLLPLVRGYSDCSY